MASPTALLQNVVWLLEQAAKDARERHEEIAGKLDDLLDLLRAIKNEDTLATLQSRIDQLVAEIGRAVPKLAREAREAVEALSAGGESVSIDRTGPFRREPTPPFGTVVPSPQLQAAPTQKLPAVPSAPTPTGDKAEDDGATAIRLAWKHRRTVFTMAGWTLAALTGGAAFLRSHGCPGGGFTPHGGGQTVDASAPLGTFETDTPLMAGGDVSDAPRRQPPTPPPPKQPAPPERHRRHPSPKRPDPPNDKEVAPKGHVALPYHEPECDGTRGPHQADRCRVPLEDDPIPEVVDELAGTDDLRPPWKRR